MNRKKYNLESEASKVHSHLMKDINRIRKHAQEQTKINILRKHQIKLLNEFLGKLLKEGRISKKELKKYNPRKRDSEKELFD